MPPLHCNSKILRRLQNEKKLFSKKKQDMLYDPQTSGGLLIAVHPDDADMLYEDLKKTEPSAQKIGYVTKQRDNKFIILE